ncbi:MAG: ice-binding family protein [Pseudomonadota bacterium]
MKTLKIILLILLVSLMLACGGESADPADSGVTDVENVDLADTTVADDDAAATDAAATDAAATDAAATDAAATDAAATDAVEIEEVGDGVPPVVTSTTPEDGATAVAFGAPITATFSKAMSPLTISEATFTLRHGTTVVPGAVTCVGEKAIFKPTVLLDPTVLYTATISIGAEDLAGNALANDHVWSFTTWTQEAQAIVQEAVPLSSSAAFAILASAAITNIPTSVITGDIGLIPDTGANISGFSDPETCPEVAGTMYVVDAAGPACALIDPTLLANAKIDAGVAFANARDAARGTPQSVSGNLNGLTLYPGLYESGSSLEISPGGFLTLDGQGDGDAIFIIRSATSITTEATSEVVLTSGAKAANVYWTAGSAVTLGVNSIMKGTLLAGTALSLQTGANLQGRALNQGPAAEAITLDSCTITVPSP